MEKQLTDTAFKSTEKSVGASLLAIAICQSTLSVNVSPQSRASSLPQVLRCLKNLRPSLDQEEKISV
ncbi:hypothetical protein EIY71_02590 [Pseudomonas sp. CH235]|nr:hypothetical protein EIY71_02590 [Pseudomonas sp. CH235]